MLLVLAALAAVPAQEPNDAEKLFRNMEEKVAKAKTVKLAFDVPVGKDTAVTGTILRAMGDKCRLEWAWVKAGQSEDFLVVSDGRQIIARGLPQAPGKGNTPKDLDKLLIKSIAEYGVVSTTEMFIVEQGVVKLRGGRDWTCSDFRLGKKEKLGQVDVQIIEYKVGNGAKVSAKLWLDSKTGLPLKRSYLLLGKPCIETYSQFVLDEKMEDKLFQLP